MRLVTAYLIGYFVLIGAAVVVLWQSGILEQIPYSWAVVGAATAIALGVLLAVVSRPSTTVRD